MKRLWLSVFLLILLFSAALTHVFFLSAFTEELTGLLLQAEAQGEAGDWEEAISLTRTAHARWQARGTYLHITLRHADIDEVYLGFLQVEQFLEQQKDGEYSAANAALIGHLSLLSEQEAPSLKNIL